MEALYLLVPLSILIVFVAIWVFFSMSDSGQFDDMVGPALRILKDDGEASSDDPDRIPVDVATDIPSNPIDTSRLRT